MRMTSTGALPRALAAAKPPKPPPTITTRGVFDLCSPAPLIEFKLASFIHPFLKLLSAEISQKLLSPTDWWESRPRQEDDLMTLRDRFLHYLPPLYRQWSHAAFGQTPQSFVLVPVVEKNDAFACV